LSYARRLRWFRHPRPWPGHPACYDPTGGCGVSSRHHAVQGSARARAGRRRGAL